ncbi:MAG: hypothetical protein NTY35_14400 [Planctomycetota bacterium]|nr:hypothetical protein [Planctomycetota bacterium]
MSAHHLIHGKLALLLALGGAGLVACRSADPAPAAADELEARVQDEVEARLRTLFPEIRGPITRAAVAASVQAETDLGGTADSGGSDAVRARAVAALRRGDDEGARQILSELAADREAQAARALRTAGDVDGALAGFGRALDIAPHSSALRRERAETALDEGLRRGDRDRLESALVDFQEATRRARGEDPDLARTWLGTSRAARALGDAPRALDAARRAFASARGAADLEGATEIAERTRAEAVLGALSASDPAGNRAALVTEAREALEALLARTPDEPWAWARLSEVLQVQGASSRARAAARTGLTIFPRDAQLAEALAVSTRSLGGREAVVATFEELERRDPADAGAIWRPAQERYERGIEALAHGAPSKGTEENFREAGRGFLRAGALAADRRSEANAAVARCLAGVGFVLQAQGDLAGARRAFVEADERDPRSIAEPLTRKLPSGIEALRSIASLLRERGADPSRADATDCLVEAAATYSELRRIAPRDTDEAALTATLARDAALALEARARVAADRGRRETARVDMDRARGLMEAAYSAAADAARQRPEDAAAVRAPGRLLAHFLQRDVTQAEAWLRSAVKLSEDEVARARAAAQEPGLDAAQREERARRQEEAESRLGDAYQDLGVLHLDLKGDPHGAKAWFEKALGTGPDPREDLRAEGGWIARCDAAIATGTDSRLSPEKRWGALP